MSANSNADIIEYLSARCESLGFEISRHVYKDDNGIEKTNLIALAGPKPLSHSAELALVGHTDTVPFDQNWKDALVLTETDGKLFGRGACDTKAFIAAALIAAESVDLSLLKQPLALVFTADEEIGLVGAKRLAEAQALKVRHAIVGEPTSLQPMRAGKGYCLAEVTLKGREGHSAYPALGHSAIADAARMLVRVKDVAENLKKETHAAFDPPYTTLNVGVISGGTAKNVIAGECRFTLEWRPIPGQNPERLLNLLNEAIAEEKSVNDELIAVVDASRADHGFETSADSQLVQLLEELSGNKSGTVAFGTEAEQMTALGAEAVVFGPGNIRVAHRTDEFVPVDELIKCSEILTDSIKKLCF